MRRPYGSAVGNRPPRPPFGINRNSPQFRDLNYWWPFLQPGEGRVVRELITDAHATFDSSMDTASWVSTRHDGRAVAFDGTSADVATVPDEAGLSLPLTNYTISFWFNAPVWTTGRGLIGKWITTDREWIIWCETSGGTGTNSLTFARYAAGLYTPTTLTNAAFYDDTPTFLCGRTATNGDIDLIVWKPSLGLVKSTPVADPGGWTTSGAEPLTFGSYGVNAGPGNEFACDIWDVRFYGRALSDADILHMALPQTRWDLYLDLRTRRIWPATAGGGASTFTVTSSVTASLAPLAARVTSAARSETVSFTPTAVKTFFQTLAETVSFTGAAAFVRAVSIAVTFAFSREPAKDDGPAVTKTVFTSLSETARLTAARTVTTFKLLAETVSFSAVMSRVRPLALAVTAGFSPAVSKTVSKAVAVTASFIKQAIVPYFQAVVSFVVTVDTDLTQAERPSAFTGHGGLGMGDGPSRWTRRVSKWRRRR